MNAGRTELTRQDESRRRKTSRRLTRGCVAACICMQNVVNLYLLRPWPEAQSSTLKAQSAKFNRMSVSGSVPLKRCAHAVGMRCRRNRHRIRATACLFRHGLGGSRAATIWRRRRAIQALNSCLATDKKRDKSPVFLR